MGALFLYFLPSIQFCCHQGAFSFIIRSLIQSSLQHYFVSFSCFSEEVFCSYILFPNYWDRGICLYWQRITHVNWLFINNINPFKKEKVSETKLNLPPCNKFQHGIANKQRWTYPLFFILVIISTSWSRRWLLLWEIGRLEICCDRGAWLRDQLISCCYKGPISWVSDSLP